MPIGLVHEDTLQVDTAILALVESGVEELAARIGNGPERGAADPHGYGATVRKAIAKASDLYFEFVDHRYLQITPL